MNNTCSEICEQSMTQEKRRVKRIYARVAEEEYAKIQEQADVAAISISEFLRRRALGRKIAAKFDLRVLAELRKLGGLVKFVYTETRGAYSEKTAEAIQSLTACARAIERKISQEDKDNVEEKQ